MDKKKIDSIIWGEFDEKILEKQIPFYASTWYLKEDIEEKIFLLFRLFTNYVFERNGYRNLFASMSNLDAHNYYDWREQNSEQFDYIGYEPEISRVFTPPPIYFTEFEKEGERYNIFFVVNTYSFFEALLWHKEIMEDPSLEEKYQKVESDTKLAFDFIQDTQKNIGSLQNPVIVLRPIEMLAKMSALDNYFEDFSGLPTKLFTKEENTDPLFFSPYDFGSLVEDDLNFKRGKIYNFKELVEKFNTFLPNFEIMTSYELLMNKIPLDLHDWEEKRDSFIKDLEERIESEFSFETANFDRELEYLKKAQEFHDMEHFEESILNCHKALEGILGKKFSKVESLPFFEKIEECRREPRFRRYIDNLNYINKIRNKFSAHANSEKPNLDESSMVLQMTNITFTGLTKNKVHGKYGFFEK